MDGTVLVADDDRTIRTVLTQALTRAGCRVRATSNTATLWRWVEEGEGDVVISDVMMPDGNGLDLLPAIRRKRPDLPVIIISAQNTMMTAVNANKAGAYDYLSKPFDLKELLTKVRKALSAKSVPVVAPVPQNDIPLVGRSDAMQNIYRVFARVLQTPLNVMVIGESGTGKSLLARSFYDLSGCTGNYCVLHGPTVTSADISQTLVGCPSGSTLYVDEVGELSASAQATLLSVLQSGAFQDEKWRVISSNQHPVLPMVREGLFREDLYYRLNVMPMTLPPLRDRLEDIVDLTEHFLGKSHHDIGAEKFFLKEAMDVLRAYSWPGNVRELENFVQRVLATSTEVEIDAVFVAATLDRIEPTEVRVAHDEKLGASVGAHLKRYFDLHGDDLPPPGLYQRILQEVEAPLIALSLAATRGNQLKTADLLGLNRNTLRKKIKELDIEVTRSKKMM